MIFTGSAGGRLSGAVFALIEEDITFFVPPGSDNLPGKAYFCRFQGMMIAFSGRERYVWNYIIE